MIQQPQEVPQLAHRPVASGARGFPSTLLLLALLAGCRTVAHDVEIPRTLGGEEKLGRFVPPFAYEAYVRGELAIARGDFPDAIAQLELATAAPEEDAYLLSRLAWAQALNGDGKGSERTLAQAAKVDACSEAVWTTRGKLAERARDLPRARDAYAQAATCAPASALGPLGLSRVLVALGERERAQSVLEAFALRSDRPAAQKAALALAISREDALAIGVAVDGVLASGAPGSDMLHAAIEQALALGRPLLAARLIEHAKTPVPAALATRVCLARGDVPCAQAALALTSTEALASPSEAAELLLAAELYERAEIEASVALVSAKASRLYLVRAQARAALGDTTGALDDLAHVEDSEHAAFARALLVTLTRAQGLPGLASELEVRRDEGASLRSDSTEGDATANAAGATEPAATDQAAPAEAQ